MDYNEKLRLAKEALASGFYDKETIEYIFPELKERDDEKIRKDIIIYLQYSMAFDKSFLDKKYNWSQKDCSKWIAWLEKQGQTFTSKDVDDAYLKCVCDAKRELEKQGEQSPVDKVEHNIPHLTDFENAVKDMMNDYRYAIGDNDATIEEIKELATYLLSLIHQRPTWSEEDEEIYQSIMDDTVQENQLNDKQTNWLRDIKYRYFPQPKQEWKQENTGDLNDFENAMMHIGNSFFSQHAGLDPNNTNAIKEQANLLLELVPNKERSKEDENNILFLTSIIEEYFKDKENITLCGDTNCANFTKENVINRLKSLRPQNTWKPSEGQLECLGYAIDKAEKDWSPLTNNRIYLTLKALKEQLLELIGSKV